MVSENLCPVCGYQMQDPPRDYNICPSCGTEFGHHDVNASISDLRCAWLRTGPKWWSTLTPAPENWKPLEQLASVPYTAGTVSVLVAIVFTEPEELRDLVSPAVIELKEAITTEMPYIPPQPVFAGSLRMQ